MNENMKGSCISNCNSETGGDVMPVETQIMLSSPVVIGSKIIKKFLFFNYGVMSKILFKCKY